MKREKATRHPTRSIRVRWAHLRCGRGVSIPPHAARHRKKLLLSRKDKRL